jgi:hypothetical protein
MPTSLPDHGGAARHTSEVFAGEECSRGRMPYPRREQVQNTIQALANTEQRFSPAIEEVASLPTEERGSAAALELRRAIAASLAHNRTRKDHERLLNASANHPRRFWLLMRHCRCGFASGGGGNVLAAVLGYGGAGLPSSRWREVV